jgi:sec-independent protein translocase protein TatA
MSLGFTEMLVLLAIVLIVFGAGKLPSVMGDLAKGIRNFKAGMKDEPELPASHDAPPATREPARITGERPTTPAP